MEILDNSLHFNQQRDQNHYSPSASIMNPIGTLRRSQGEDNDVGFLLRCKKELSKEVIRWKEENLSLQKTNDSNVKKLDELRHMIKKLTEKNSQLETQLLAADEENEQLRLHSLAVDNENSILFRKLSQGLNKYHSFPWANSPHSPSPHPHHTFTNEEQIIIKEATPSQDWKEVSQKLFDQMKQEMRELQEMNNCFSIDDEKLEDIVKCPKSDFIKIENRVFSLSSKTESLRQYLLCQRENLELLINCVDKGQTPLSTLPCSSNSDAKDKNLPNLIKHHPVNSSDLYPTQGSKDNLKNIFPRPSDESFRDYFTRQLQGKQSENMASSVMMQLYMESKKKEIEQLRNSTSQSEPTPSNPVIWQSCNRIPQSDEVTEGQSSTQGTILNTSTPPSDEDRICPICEAVFPRVVGYKDFEAHVVEHLENESASLLDQYVIL